MDFEKEVTELLGQVFPGCQIIVTNISHQHAHGGPGGQSHFHVVVVSDLFANTSLLQRHRQVQQALQGPISQIKAMSLHTLTTEEWYRTEGQVGAAPRCAGSTTPP